MLYSHQVLLDLTYLLSLLLSCNFCSHYDPGLFVLFYVHNLIGLMGLIISIELVGCTVYVDYMFWQRS